MVSVCLPSDALLQHLRSYLGFSYLGRGVSLHGCSSKAQPLLLTLDEGYLLTTASWASMWDSSSRPSCARAATAPWTCGWSSRPLPLASVVRLLLLPVAPDLGCGVGDYNYSCGGRGCGECVISSVLSPHNKNLKWRTLKPLVHHSSQCYSSMLQLSFI